MAVLGDLQAGSETIEDQATLGDVPFERNFQVCSVKRNTNKVDGVLISWFPVS